MKFTVIKEYSGIEVGTKRECSDIGKINHMVNCGYWEEVLEMAAPKMPTVKAKEQGLNEPELKEKPKRVRPKKVK